MTIERQDTVGLGLSDQTTRGRHLARPLMRAMGVVFGLVVGIATIIQALIELIVNWEVLIDRFQGVGTILRYGFTHLLDTLLATTRAGIVLVGQSVFVSVFVLIFALMGWEMLLYRAASMKKRRYPQAYVDARLRQYLTQVGARNAQGGLARRRIFRVIVVVVFVSVLVTNAIPAEWHNEIMKS